MKKSILQTVLFMLVFPFFNGAFFSLPIVAQPSIGILPVAPPASYAGVLNNQQISSLTLQMQNHFKTQLKTMGNTTLLTREHVLLLLKEVPAPDPVNLTEEAFKIISTKERLNYLLRCSIESMESVNNTVLIMASKIIFVEGNSGKIVYEKKVNGEAVVQLPVNEQIILNKIFIPSVAPVLKEIKALNL